MIQPLLAVITTLRFSQPFLRNQQSAQPHLLEKEGKKVHHSVFSKAKRSVDILGSVIGLVIMATLIIPITIAIKLDNPGPILYSQIRCGLHGKHFRIWKFRSMVVGAEQQKHLVKNQAKGQIFKNENDPRITRVGSFLRRTSLDELPQEYLLSVLFY